MKNLSEYAFITPRTNRSRDGTGSEPLAPFISFGSSSGEVRNRSEPRGGPSLRTDRSRVGGLGEQIDLCTLRWTEKQEASARRFTGTGVGDVDGAVMKARHTLVDPCRHVIGHHGRCHGGWRALHTTPLGSCSTGSVAGGPASWVGSLVWCLALGFVHVGDERRSPCVSMCGRYGWKRYEYFLAVFETEFV
jgi:hypothetical protein